MRKATRLGVLCTLVGAGTLAFFGGTAVAAPPNSPAAYTCSGGAVPTGNYASITIAGYCGVSPGAVITVVGDINVLPGAVFDAQSAAATITVGHNVTAGEGALLGLGCQPNGTHAEHPCTVDPNDSSVITVDGNVTATDTDLVLLNGITVDGNVTIIGGGDEEIPWTVKNDTIDGNLTISDLVTTWIGVLFNTVGGNATLTNITVNDPGDLTPTMQIALNNVGHNLNCSGIGPYVSGGFAPGEVNTVGGRATGQCLNLQSGF